MTDGAVKKYYAFGGGTVAMRDGNGLQYFLTDHLGSVLAVTDSSGTLISEQRYLPFGEVRDDVGTITQTDFGYTFQRGLPGTGLMDYRARFYAPYITHFSQPDSIIPDFNNPQALNRYAYSLNNPIRFSDPTGHKICEDLDCNNDGDSKRKDKDKDEDKDGDDNALGYNGWDWVTGVRDVRSIIRGMQVANVVSQQSGFMDQQAALQHWYNNCYGNCHYADTPGYVAGSTVGGPMPEVPLVDSYSEGMGEAISGVVNLGIQAAIIKIAPVQTFAHGGPEWHVGLETTENMNILHVGNHAQYGVHIAFGAIRPYVANLHMYIQKAFPFFRIWKP